MDILKKLNYKLEELFDQDPHHNWLIEQNFLEAQKTYASESNLSSLNNLSYVYTNEVNSENVQSFLTQLACHFEGVLLLQQQTTGQFQVTRSILFGKPVSESIKWPEVNWPEFKLYQVYKTAANGLFKKLRLTALAENQKASAYLIKTGDGSMLIVFTTQAEPWAKLKMTSLQHTLMKINFNL
jgi:hypothetical protein